MLAQTEIYMDAIEHLPSGATLRLSDVSWDEYEELLAQIGDNGPATA